MIDVLIVEDHPVVVEGLKKLLLEHGLAKLCVTASSGKECLTYLKNYSPDIVLLDINLPDINGIDLCKTMMTEYPTLKILAISSFSQRSYIVRMMEKGALGYVLKNSSEEEILDAINDVVKGIKHLGYEVNEILNKSKNNDNFPLLSRRESEVLKFIADGIQTRKLPLKCL